MDILLINPPTTHMVRSGISKFIDSFSSSSPMPPLGLMYLAAFLEEHSYSVKICDMNIGESLSQHFIWDDRPKFVGITATTLNLYDVLLVAKNIKEFDKNIKVIVGGTHCSIYPEETVSFPNIDYVVVGEGEFPIIDILNGANKGIIGPKTVDDIDSLPFPARHLLKGNYGTALSRKKSASLVSSRNCPMHCTFCYQPKYGYWKARSAMNVVDEMNQLAQSGIGEVEIYDDTFTLNRQRVIQICSLILQRKIRIDWNIRTRVDRVDDELLALMKSAGCKRINYGIESISQRTLDILGKGFSVDQIIKAIELTKKYGIEIQAYFMLGSPGETFEEMRQTVEFAKKMRPDYAYFSITSPMPGTRMYQQWLKGDHTDYWKNFAWFPCPDTKIKIWDEKHREQIAKLVEDAYRSFYFNPAYILKQQLKVRSWKEFKGKAEMALRMLK